MKLVYRNFTLFVAAGLPVAALVAVGGRLALDRYANRGLASLVSTERLSEAPFSAEAVQRRVYSGYIVNKANTLDHFSVSFPDKGAGRIVLKVVLGGGHGEVGLVGLVEPHSGRFRAGLTEESAGFPIFRTVFGRVAGPALVNGVNCMWIELDPVIDSTDVSSIGVFYGWSGVLRLTGRQD